MKYRVRCEDCQLGRPEPVSLVEAEAWRKYHAAVAPAHRVTITEHDASAS